MNEKKFKTFADLRLVPPKTEPSVIDASKTEALTSQPSVSSRSSLSSQPKKPNPKVKPKTLPKTADEFPVAPVKNFHRVANSVNSQALQTGLFKTGAYKKIYDALYLLTRGAVNPTRTIKIKKSELMKKSNIGARVTLDAGVAHLQSVGLIKVNVIGGAHAGNEFEVFLPEEIEGMPSQTRLSRQSSISSQARDSSHAYFPDTLDSLENRQSSQAHSIDNKGTYSDAKTLYNTKEENLDDERLRAAFGELELILDKTVKNLTGRETTPTDKERWKHVAEILAAQLELIASRTTISNAPAILAEHLHRHLNNKRVQEKMGLLTPAEAREAKEEKESEKAKEVIPDLYLCPDCYGTNFWNPDGRGKRRGCPHPRLEEARQRAASEEME